MSADPPTTCVLDAFDLMLSLMAIKRGAASLADLSRLSRQTKGYPGLQEARVSIRELYNDMSKRGCFTPPSELDELMRRLEHGTTGETIAETVARIEYTIGEIVTEAGRRDHAR